MKTFLLALACSAVISASFTGCDDKTKSTTGDAPRLVTMVDRTLTWSCDECPVIEFYTGLQAHGERNRKIEEWQRYVSDPRNRLSDVHHVKSFFINKDDLMKLLCDNCNDAEGILVTFGYESGNTAAMTDTSTNKPRKLLPFISAAKLNQAKNGFDPIGELNMYSDQGCPSAWCTATQTQTGP